MKSVPFNPEDRRAEHPCVDHAFVAREVGDAPVLLRHRLEHERIRRELGSDYARALICALAPELRLSHEQADALWPRIVRHKRELETALGRRVRISVAALDYLHGTVGALHHPLLVSESGFAAIERRGSAALGGEVATNRFAAWARSVTQSLSKGPDRAGADLVTR